MKDRPPTLYEAIEGFLGPLMAEYARLIDEGNPDLPVIVKLGGYEHKTTLAVLKKLDRAHHAAFETKLGE